MTNWAIVAIPEDRDPVWKYSSEKVPHMTLLFLGDQTLDEDLPRVVQYIAHVAKTVLHPFGMMVDRRGTLGDEQADVLFFEKDKRGTTAISQVRHCLLQDPGIKKMYDSTQQYPEWIPHLTMGFPKTPAKKDDRDYPGFSYIAFDRIALWTGDYEGPTFQLEGRDLDVVESEMVMNDTVEEFLSHFGVETNPTGKFLEHFGVKGMKWGRRSSDIPDGEVRTSQKKPGRKVTAEGGRGTKAHDDAVRAAIQKQTAKKSTTDALSNKDLQELVTRMNLEQQYSKLAAGTVSPGRKFVNDLLINTAKQQASQVINQQASSLVEKQLKKAGAK